jgi:hypothetical protein
VTARGLKGKHNSVVNKLRQRRVCVVSIGARVCACVRLGFRLSPTLVGCVRRQVLGSQIVAGSSFVRR